MHAGKEWLEKRAVGRALGRILKRETEAQQPAQVLTLREAEIMRMVASGLPNRAIAERLSISEGTVKVHLHNIYEKLKVDGRLALLLYARDRGLA